MGKERTRRSKKWVVFALIAGAFALLRRGSSAGKPVVEPWPPVPRAPDPSKAP